MELKYVYVCALVRFSSTFTLVISFPSWSLVKQIKNQTLWSIKHQNCQRRQCV